jgi:hypothetical protein
MHMSHPFGSLKLVQGLLSRFQVPFKAMSRGCQTVRPVNCVTSSATPQMKSGLRKVRSRREGKALPEHQQHQATVADLVPAPASCLDQPFNLALGDLSLPPAFLFWRPFIALSRVFIVKYP